MKLTNLSFFLDADDAVTVFDGEGFGILGVNADRSPMVTIHVNSPLTEKSPQRRAADLEVLEAFGHKIVAAVDEARTAAS